MGNENNSSIQKKNSNTLNDDGENQQKIIRKPNKRSSVKPRSFRLNKGHYHGQIFGGIKEGYGICYYKNGDKYEGTWKDNKKDGKGSFYYNEKEEVYRGNFINDYPNGNGIYYFKNGDRYEGLFKDGKKHGEGTIFFANGGRYKGLFKNNLKHG